MQLQGELRARGDYTRFVDCSTPIADRIGSALVITTAVTGLANDTAVIVIATVLFTILSADEKKKRGDIVLDPKILS